MRGSHGFTLIEVMMAFAIFAIGFLGIAEMEAIAVQNGASAQRANEAETLAQELASRLQTLSYTDPLLADTTTANDSALFNAGVDVVASGSEADHCADSVSAFPAGWVDCTNPGEVVLGMPPMTELVDSTTGLTRYYLVWDVEDAQLRRVNGVPDLPPNSDGGQPISTDGKVVVARVLYSDPVFGSMQSASAVAIVNNPAVFGY